MLINRSERSRYARTVECVIDCYERSLFILWNGSKTEAEVQREADAAYDRWVHVDENPEVEDFCCEEYIVAELEKLGFDFDYAYSEEEK